MYGIYGGCMEIVCLDEKEGPRHFNVKRFQQTLLEKRQQSMVCLWSSVPEACSPCLLFQSST